MASFNKVLLLGNLTRDPELRTTNSGTPVCSFGVAVSRTIRGSDGESREEVVFIDIDAFGKQAEVISRYFTKGRPIFIEGRLRLDQWETQAGERRSKLSVILDSFQFIGSRSDEDRSSSAYGDSNSSQKLGNPDLPPKAESFEEEDVPF